MIIKCDKSIAPSCYWHCFSTSKPFHIHLFIIMSTVCIILLWVRS